MSCAARGRSQVLCSSTQLQLRRGIFVSLKRLADISGIYSSESDSFEDLHKQCDDR